MKRILHFILITATLSCSQSSKSVTYLQNDSSLMDYIVRINEDLHPKELSLIQCLADGPEHQSGVRLYLTNFKDSTRYYDDFATALQNGNRIKVLLGGCYGGFVGDNIDITIIDSTYYIEHTHWTDVGDRTYKPILQSLVLNKSEFIVGETIRGEFEFEGLAQYEKRGYLTPMTSRSSWSGYFETEVIGEEVKNANRH